MNKLESPFTGKAVVTVIAIAMLSALSVGQVGAQSNAKVERSVEGVWLATVTPRDCTSGVPFLAAAFESIHTFHRDGTMESWLQNAMITVTRSPSYGLWQRERGWSEYSFRFVHLRYDPSGFYAGRQESAGSLVLSESGNEFTTDGQTRLFDVDGNLLGVGCANMVATRFD